MKFSGFLCLSIVVLLMLCGCLQESNHEPNGNNNPQVIQIIASQQTGFSPLNVSFSVQLNNPNLEISTYSWDFNDGLTSTSISPMHQFFFPGDYLINLTVTLNDGTVETDSLRIQVYEKQQFYGTWHYLQGVEYYEIVVLYPNGTLSLKFSDTGEKYQGTFQISNNYIKFDIPLVHHFPSFYYEFTNMYTLSLTNIRELETSSFIKERSNVKTHYVGGLGSQNYSIIQEAIDDAWYGDTIVVYQGTYFENIKITKAINLVGKDRQTTIINAASNGDVVEISSDYVKISNFTIQNSQFLEPHAGIKISLSSQVHCDNCQINNNYYGIWLYGSSENTITNSSITLNKFDGVMIHDVSRENRLSSCDISKNSGNGITFCCGSNFNIITNCTIRSNNGSGISVPTSGNVIYLNKFVNNNGNAVGYGVNYWDNGYSGNYWSDFDEPHEGAYDNNEDGIIDSPYTNIGGNNQDQYPLKNL